MKLLDRLARKLALRWLKGKVGEARKEGNTAMKIADGKKNWLIVLCVVLVSALYSLTGVDLRDLMRDAFVAMDWNDPVLIERTQRAFLGALPLVLSAWAAYDRYKKRRAQIKAGATPAEALTTIGYLKEAAAAGQLVSDTVRPVTIEVLAEKPRVEEATPPVVAAFLVIPARAASLTAK